MCDGIDCDASLSVQPVSVRPKRVVKNFDEVSRIGFSKVFVRIVGCGGKSRPAAPHARFYGRVGVCQSRQVARLPAFLPEIRKTPAVLPVFSRNFWMFC